MGHLMSTQVPFVLHRLVAFVAANISSYRMHVQDMLEKKSFAFFFQEFHRRIDVILSELPASD